jgi:putative spermidine/putrescine transport system substrate-binding protein
MSHSGRVAGSRRRQTVLVAVMVLFAAAIYAGTTAAATTTRHTGSVTLTYVSYGGALQTAEESALIKPFEKLHPNIKIVYDPTVSYTKLVSMVQSHNVSWDVVDVGNDFGLSPSDTKYLTKIDCKTVPCGSVQPGMYPTTGYRVNWSPSGEALGYNTTLMPSGKVPTSWADFFDTTKFPGKRIAMNPDTGSWTYEEALVAAGVPRNHLYPLNLNKALAEWDKIKSDTTFTENFQQCAESVATGDAAMGMCWSGRFYDVKKSGAPVAVSWNGTTLNGGYYVVPKGDPHVTEAMEFIAYAVSKKAQAAMSNAIPYGPANVAAMSLIKPSIKPWLGVSHRSQAIFINDQWWSKNRDRAFKTWQAWLTK